jgi:hypothetical protein
MTIVTVLLIAAATTAIGLILTRNWAAIERFLFRRKVLRATIEPAPQMPALTFERDPGVFEAELPNWEAYGYVIPSDIHSIGPPPTDLCREWLEWARARQGVDAYQSKIQVVVEGRNEGQVVIDRFELEIGAKREPLGGTHVACVVGGASASPREIFIDLDRDPPRMQFRYEGDEPTEHFLFTLSDGETETFRIRAITERHYCEWIARLGFVANGRREFIEVSDEGDSFRTTGTGNATSYAWMDGQWSSKFFEDLR